MALHPFPSRGTYSEDTADTILSLEDAAADHATWIPGWPITVTHFGAVVVETLACDVTAPVISLDDRVTAGSDTGRVEIDTITFTDAQAPGTTLIAALATPYRVGMGHELVFEHKTQGADGGTAAGQCRFFVCYETDGHLNTDDANYVAA